MVIAIVLLLVIVGPSIWALKLIKNAEKSEKDFKGESVASNEDNSIDFYPFKWVKNGVLYLGDFKYRIFIEVPSLNYALTTDEEKAVIESQFGRIHQSIDFPITHFVQTRPIDNYEVLESTKKDVERAVQNFPALREYGDVFLTDLSNLSNYLGQNKEKRKFAIIPFNEAKTLANLSPEEKEEYSLKEIRDRANLVVSGFQGMKLGARILNSEEVYSLIYSSIHRDDIEGVREIRNGTWSELIVEGDTNDMDEKQTLDWILYEAQNRIKLELADKSRDNEEVRKYADVIKKIGGLR